MHDEAPFPGREEDSSSGDFGLSTLFFDHVVKKETKQDGVAFVSILEAVLGQVRKELPNVSEVWLLSDMASCYQNNLRPVIAPLMTKGVVLALKGRVHSETQGGNIWWTHILRSQ